MCGRFGLSTTPKNSRVSFVPTARERRSRTARARSGRPSAKRVASIPLVERDGHRHRPDVKGLLSTGTAKLVQGPADVPTLRERR